MFFGGKMTLRNDVLDLAKEKYKTDAEYPWAKFPSYAVLRHSDNKKWYAVIMNIPKEKLGIYGGGNVDVINLKNSPIALGGLIMSGGIFPAYHMSKGSWISVLLDGSVEMDEIKTLLDISYQMTQKKAVQK